MSGGKSTGVTPVLRRARARLRSSVGGRPSLFFALYGPSARTRRLGVTPASRIVIEGFPRSANSFAVVAFALAQGESSEAPGVAHHLHVPAQVQRGIRLGIPTIVLLRHPVDAVASLLLREPWRTPDSCFGDYVGFYRAVSRCPESGYVVGEFSEVTARFGRVIAAVNDRFRTRFRPFEHTEENVRAVFAELETLETVGGRIEERAVARPSERRDRWKARARESLRTEADAGRIAEAVELYEELRDRSG